MGEKVGGIRPSGSGPVGKAGCTLQAQLSAAASWADCTEKNAIFVKKGLKSPVKSCILLDVVTLIAMKREVAALLLQVFRGANVKL